MIDKRFLFAFISIIITTFGISLYKRSKKENLDYSYILKIAIISGVVVFAATHLQMQQFEEVTMEGTIPFNSSPSSD